MPPVGTRRRRTNLVEPLPRLLGRDALVDEARGLLTSGHRVVSVTGAAGMGKSAFAAVLARTILDEESPTGGVRFVELPPAGDEVHVVRAFARALDVPLAACRGVDQAAALLSALFAARAPMLVVVDGDGPTVPVAAMLLRRFLAAAVELRVVIASRASFGLDGETHLLMPPLDEGAAHALWLQRAGAPPTDADLAAARGVPLAIELLAALPKGARARAADRVVLAAVEALDDAQRAQVLRLTRFATPFTDARAARLLGVDEDSARQALDALSARGFLAPSLFEKEQRALHPAVRELAAEALTQTAIKDDARARHATFALDEARAGRPDAEELGKALRDGAFAGDAATAEAALVLAAVLDEEGPVEARRRAAERAVIAARATNDEGLRARALLARAEAVLFERPDSAVAADLDDARAIAVKLGDARLLAAERSARTALHLAAGQATAARSAIEEALAGDGLSVATPAGSKARGRALLRRADAKIGEGLLDDAERDAGAAAALFGQTSGAREEGEATAVLGRIQQERGRLVDARRSIERALELQDATIDRWAMARTLSELGLLHVEEGASEDARGQLERALRIARELAHPRLIGMASTALGVLHHMRGRLGEAQGLYERGGRLALEAGDAAGAARASSWLGALKTELDDLGGAEEAFAMAEEAARMVGQALMPELLAVHRKFVDVARAAKMPHENPTAAALLGAAGKVARSAAQSQSSHARVAATVLFAVFERLPGPLKAAAGGARITVSPDGRIVESESSKVDLTRRGPLRRILARLAVARFEQPGTALPLDALLEAGWPGERVLREAGQTRVYTAVHTLRKLGLDEHLITRDDGYFLNPDAVVVWPEPERS